MLLEAKAEELKQADAELIRRLRDPKKANLIPTLGYDEGKFPTVAIATARLNRESRALREQVNLDRQTPWTLETFHPSLRDTLTMFGAIAAVLTGLGVVLTELNYIINQLNALFIALTNLLHTLGVPI